MKRFSFLRGFSVLLLASAVTSAILGYALFAIIFGLGWILSIVAQFVMRSREPQGLGAEAQWMLRPLQQAQHSFLELARSSDRPEVAAVAQEAAAEAAAMIERAQTLVLTREALKKSLKGRAEAQTNLSRLQRQYVDAKSGAESTALESAIEARQKELATYDLAQSRVQEIESKLKEAEATLAAMKAQLSAGLANPTMMDVEGFDDIYQRLKTLGTSFEEAQEFLEVKGQ